MIVDRDMQLKAKVCYSQPIQSSIANIQQRQRQRQQRPQAQQQRQRQQQFF